MPKSKNRKNHNQKVQHQRMLDAHKKLAAKKLADKQMQEFEKMIEESRKNIATRRSQHAKDLAEQTEPTDAEIMMKAATEGVVIG